MTDQEEIQAVIAEARTWVGTPHRHRQMVKGAGVDCALLLLCSWSGAGIVELFDPGFYTHDWHMHKSEELYLSKIEQYMAPVDTRPLTTAERLEEDPSFSVDPGRVMMMRYGRTYSHGVIVTEWPNIVHAYFPSGIVEEVSILGTPLMEMPTKIYSYWGDR